MSVKKNLVLNFINQLMTMLMPLVLTPYLTRILGAEQLGVYSFEYNRAYYFTLFVLLGLNNYGNRAIAKVRDNPEQRSKTFLSIYALQLMSGILCLGIFLAEAVLRHQNFELRIAMAFLVLSSIFDVNWFFSGMELFYITITRNIVLKTATIIAVLALVKDSSDTVIYAVIISVGALINTLYIWGITGRYVGWTAITRKEVVKHIKPNLVLFLPVIAISIYNIMDKLLLGWMSDYSQVGFYDASEKIMFIPKSMITALGIVMLPRISGLISSPGNEKKIKDYIDRSVIFSLFFSSLATFGIMGVAKEFVPMYYGSGFESCVILYKILLPGTVFEAVASVIRTQYLIPYGFDKKYVASVFAGAIVNLLIDILLISKYGAAGAAVGTFFAEFAVFLVQYIAVRRELNLRRAFLQSAVMVINAIIMYAILECLPLKAENIFAGFMIKLLVGFLVYAALTAPYYFLHLKKFLDIDRKPR